MRVMSYNVRYFGHGLKGLASTAKSKRTIAQAIASMAALPDVIALQEVETRSIRARVATRATHPDETQLEAFLRHLERAMKERGQRQPYEAWYFPAHTYRLGSLTFYTTGLSVLVNGQTLASVANNGSTPHAITHHRNERLRRVKQTRIAAHLGLETLEGKRFHLINTHLSLPTAWAPEFWSHDRKMGFGKNQLAEAKAVAQFAAHAARGEPYLLVGDFNSSPASPVYEFLTKEANLRGAQEVLKQIDPTRPDGFASAGFLRLRMHLDHLFGSKIDFLDLEGTLPFGDARSPFNGLSDHVPLIARFGW